MSWAVDSTANATSALDWFKRMDKKKNGAQH